MGPIVRIDRGEYIRASDVWRYVQVQHTADTWVEIINYDGQSDVVNDGILKVTIVNR